MTDQLDRLVDDIRGLADADVPVGLDHRYVVDEGGRRVRRRRGLGVAAVAVVVATVAIGIGTQSGSSDTASDPVADSAATPAPTPAPTAPPTSEPTSAPTTDEPGLRLDPAIDLTRAAVEILSRFSTAPPGGMTFAHLDSGRQEVQADVGRAGRTGYVGVVVQRTVDPDPCTTTLRPPEAQGRSCVPGGDAEGRWAVLTWSDSRQGAVTAVRVVDGGREATVATSTAVPAYDPYVDGETDPEELPWGSHSQDDAGNALPPDPALPEPPLGDEQLLEAARALLTLRLDLSARG